MIRPKKKIIFPRHWLARFYNAAGVQIKEMKINNHFQWEASEIASKESVSNAFIDDWNLTPITA